MTSPDYTVNTLSKMQGTKNEQEYKRFYQWIVSQNLLPALVKYQKCLTFSKCEKCLFHRLAVDFVLMFNSLLYAANNNVRVTFPIKMYSINYI